MDKAGSARPAPPEDGRSRVSALGALAQPWRVLDAELARHAIVRYAAAVDLCDSWAVAQRFTSHGRVFGDFGSIEGRPDIETFYYGAWRTEPGAGRHFVTNVMVTRSHLNEIDATAAFMVVGGTGRTDLGWGTYEFVLQRRGLLLSTLGIRVDRYVEIDAPVPPT